MSTQRQPNADPNATNPADAAALAAALDSARKVDFSLGHVYTTGGIKRLIDDAVLDSAFVRACLAKHARGEWGDVCEDDRQANEDALRDGSRIFSVYRTAEVEDERIWIITDAADDGGHREATTILLPSEY
jgi:hypothetical protein